MELRQSLSCRLELRLEEPVGYADGPRSPLIEGLPIEEYKKIAPVKIVKVDPLNLKFTDNPSSFRTFYELQKKWEDSIIESATKSEWKVPLICPPVVDKDNFIQDGNHRCASASRHTYSMDAVLIESQEDLDAISKLVDKGVFYFPHGKITFDQLMEKRKNSALEIDSSDFLLSLEKLRRRDYYEEEYDEDDNLVVVDNFPEGILYSEKPKVEKLASYCVGIAVHQTRHKFLGREIEPIGSIDSFDINLYDLDPKEVYPVVKSIAEKNPLVTDQTLYAIDDCVQDAMALMWRKFKRERKK